jgi:hypothetical protein
MKLFRLSTLLLFVVMPLSGMAADPVAQQMPTPPKDQTKERGKTSITFDNEVVEGMNKNSVDSAENIAQQDGSNQHLFHKRKDFKKEMPMLVHEMGESQ